MGVDVSSNLGWGAFSVNIAAQYAKSQANSDYDLNINYTFKYAAEATLVLDQSKTGVDDLSDTGKEHYNKQTLIYLPNTVVIAIYSRLVLELAW